jgi:lysozyme
VDLLNGVIDLSHHNTVASFARIRDAGVLGIIHKATQGTSFVDANYDENRAGARAAGLMWGAYHFARKGDVARQVTHFLSVAGAQAGELLVLDFEPNTTEGTMTLAEAEEFVGLVKERTGRFPGVYGGQSFLKETLGNGTTTLLANCWLWIARYSSQFPVVPPAWPGFTLWQYTDGNAGPQPHQVPGVGRCDRDKYNGDEAALRAFWANGGVAPTLPATASSPASVQPVPRRSSRGRKRTKSGAR